MPCLSSNYFAPCLKCPCYLLLFIWIAYYLLPSPYSLVLSYISLHPRTFYYSTPSSLQFILNTSFSLHFLLFVYVLHLSLPFLSFPSFYVNFLPIFFFSVSFLPIPSHFSVPSGLVEALDESVDLRKQLKLLVQQVTQLKEEIEVKDQVCLIALRPFPSDLHISSLQSYILFLTILFIPYPILPQLTLPYPTLPVSLFLSSAEYCKPLHCMPTITGIDKRTFRSSKIRRNKRINTSRTKFKKPNIETQ